MPIQVEGYRISPQQKRLWQLTRENSNFTSELLIHLKGDVEKGRLKSAVEAVMARHEALRTQFHYEPGLKDPIQVILEKGILDWSECFLEGRGAESLEHALAAARSTDREGGLNREGTVIVHVVLFSLGEREEVLSLRVPALVADTATLQNIFREIGKEYNGGAVGGVETPTQYLEFSEWQNDLLSAAEAEPGHSYWRTKTSGETAVLLFPFEKQDSQNNFIAAKVSCAIHPAVVEQVHALAAKLNAESETIWLAVWQMLLWRMVRQDEIAVNVSFSGREYDELKSACGAFSKWLPVPTRIDGTTSFLSVLATADLATKEVAEWQQYFVPEENVAQSSISFGFSGRVEPIRAGGVEMSVYGVEVRNEGYKLKLEVREGEGGWKSELHYDGGRFCRKDVECMAEQYASLLESAVKNPEASVSELDINSAEQKEKLQEWRGSGKEQSTETITAWFERQAAKSGDSVAIVFSDEKVSYRELNERANQLAHYLHEQGVRAEEKVGLLLERGIEKLVAILGVLKAGGAYVPMDPEYPQERMRMMMEDTQARVVITQKKLEEKLVVFEGLETGIVVLEQEQGQISKQSRENLGKTAESENAAYVIYTSGSTGKPKGVVITQENVVRLFQMTEGWLKFNKEDVWSLFHNYAFDVSVWEMWGAWLYGGKLVVISREETRSPEQFYEVLKREQVTILSQTPSAFRQLQPVMVEREKNADMGKDLAVRAVVFAGEALNPALVADWAKKYPETEMLNLYGITETTVHSTYKKLSREDIGQTEKSPIGVGFGDLRLYVMTEKMVEAGIWEQGEIYVAGAGLARGYLNRPELTAERFLPEIEGNGAGTGERMYKSGDLARRRGDGELEYVGRGDDQVKIRGYRVELGEIEAAVRKQGGVKETAVLVKGEGSQRRLVCYVFPEAGQEVEVERLREQLLVKLPEYMVPAVFVVLDKMPLTGNGKLDKRALPEPGNHRPKLKQQFVSPASEMEVVIANIWAEALKLEKVGVQDNFFDIGGHSMLMIQVHGKLRKVLEREIPVVDLFARPTISSLAEFLSEPQGESSFKIDEDAEQRRAVMQSQRRARAARRAAVGAEV